VAVLDTGVDTRHPLLAGHVAPGGADFVDGDGDPSDRPDGRDSDGDGLTDEAVGHGTAVAGLVLSVAPDAMILPIRILDSDGVGTAFGVALGIELALRWGAGVVNMSFGMSSLSRVVRELLEDTHDRGGLLVASAGNRAIGDPPQYPAGVPVVLGVAATDSLDRKADFSNFGPWVSVSAPGVGLVTPGPGGSFAIWSGTSFSAALVSGEAALLLSAPGLGGGKLLPRTIREGVLPLDRVDPTFGHVLGSGRIDVLAAVLRRIGRSTDLGPPGRTAGE
jgi:thermitase